MRRSDIAICICTVLVLIAIAVVCLVRPEVANGQYSTIIIYDIDNKEVREYNGFAWLKDGTVIVEDAFLVDVQDVSSMIE